MPQVLVYQTAEGKAAIVSAAPDVEIATLIESLPENTLHFAIEADDLPEGGVAAMDVDFTTKTITAKDPASLITSDMINAEKERRIALGFMFDGLLYQSDPTSIRNINGASTGALVAKAAGADGASTMWAAGGTEFSWISADNTKVPMSPDTVLSFGMAALAHVDAHTKAARVLKDDPQVDYTDDNHWPSGGAQE